MSRCIGTGSYRNRRRDASARQRISIDKDCSELRDWVRREGTADYVEAQFYVRIDEDCPVLCWSDRREGREGAAADTGPCERIQRRTWQWQRLIERRENVLEADIPEIAARVHRPISVRVRAFNPAQAANSLFRDPGRFALPIVNGLSGIGQRTYPQSHLICSGSISKNTSGSISTLRSI
jgi:hypothetical protein